jgi:tetratricopeptide (TPR) repeat protein
MSATPEMALKACGPLREHFPHAGHLIHMYVGPPGFAVDRAFHLASISLGCLNLALPFHTRRATHIDVLIGDYESCVRYNQAAITSDLFLMKVSPSTAEKEAFYFGYMVHNFHMAVYGAILGGMEAKGREVAAQLNEIVNEEMFREFPNLVSYLEAYAALDIHVLVRFGRWQEILELTPRKFIPNHYAIVSLLSRTHIDSITCGIASNKRLMLYRAASVAYARGLALAATGDPTAARREADRLDGYRQDPEAEIRILHNNSVADLLAVDATMMRGEIAYHEGKHTEAFQLLRKAVQQQHDLRFDEPWGKMQPIRHALGGLLSEQGHFKEATDVFRTDLKFHPKNPWALVGLIRCLKGMDCCSSSDEIAELEEQLRIQQQSPWTDYDVVVACECCRHPT